MRFLVLAFSFYISVVQFWNVNFIGGKILSWCQDWTFLMEVRSLQK